MPLTQEFFENPPKQYRPWTVWWWFGSSTGVDDLKWELQQMDAHGIGGVEVNPVYPLQAGDEAAGIVSTELFSDSWKQRFFAALAEAERLGMKVWLRGGSGWPFGGPWITKELASKSVARAVVDASGLSVWKGAPPKPLAPARWSDPRLECVVGVEAGGARRTMALLTNTPEEAGFQVPAGSWRLHFIYRMNTNMRVKRPGPGGSGLVMDHYSAEATAALLSVLEPIALEAKRIAPNAFLGIAEDSLELDDDNWTPGLLDEFETRRGYDPRPFLPDLWDDTPESAGVRHDYLQTVSDLMVERHFGRLHLFAVSRGFSTMTEAHGSMTDTLRAYATADVPDGETIWQFKELHEVNIRNRRVASSAAHIYGLPVAAAESYTWLRQPRFLVKPWMLKAASDAVFLDGINQIRNHGFSSSPRSLGAPGNVFYASTLINHNQTWWPHYPAVSAYVARMNFVLQQGKPANDVLVYHNLWDGMADYKRPTPEWMTGDNAWHRPDLNPGIDGSAQIAMRTKDVAEQLRKSGYGFDYINDDALLNRPLSGSVKAIVLNASKYVPASTLRRLRELVGGGIHILAVRNLPEAGVGHKEQGEQREQWRQAFGALWQTGKLIVVSDPFAMQLWLDSHISKDFDKGTGDALDFVHRSEGGREIYFISNGSDLPVATRASLRTKAVGLERWNPMDGTVSSMPFTISADGRTAVELELGPWESTVLLAGQQASMAPPARRPLSFEESTRVLELTEWELSRPGDDAVLPLPEGPVDWESIRPWKNYAGIGIYWASVRIPSPGLNEGFRYILDLGDVAVSAEVLVEGKRAGFVILPPWRIDLSGFLFPGPNRIEIRVANLWSNAVKAMPPAPSKVPGPGYGITDVLYGPSERPQQPSGLIGPVRLLEIRMQSGG